MAVGLLSVYPQAGYADPTFRRLTASAQTMRALLFVFGLLLLTSASAQKVPNITAPAVDILQLRLGQPFPIPPLFGAKDSGDASPDYTITVPMPKSSPLSTFYEYDVDVMRDTKHMHVLRAKRTFVSSDACNRALKSLIAPITKAYQLKETKYDLSLFQAEGGDLVAQADCSFVAESPYPTLNLYIYSKRARARFLDQMSKRYAR